MKQVIPLKIDDILDKASSGCFQIPSFQREFVWKKDDICSLVESALVGLPCGALVTWENPSGLSQSNRVDIRIPENNSGTKTFINFPPKGQIHPAPYVVIDGLQRITAIAIAFGGLYNSQSNHRFGGKFFIDLDSPQIEGSVRYKKLKFIKDNKLDDENTWKSTGLYPLNTCSRPLINRLSNSNAGHWVAILQLVGGDIKRTKRVSEIIASAGNPVMAEMQLDGSLSLGEIADSFELLNTRGTPVSVVDILHSTMFEWFKTNHKKDWELRDWIESINEDTLSKGWGTDSRRQIILQFGVAIDLAASVRKLPRNPHTDIPENIKAKDILNLNEEHWYDIDNDLDLFKESINKFQKCVLGRQFPEIDCPYPISASIYISLYWKLKKEKVNWSEKRLNQIFKAFFWSNALSEGYETDSHRVPKDIKDIEELLSSFAGKKDLPWKAAVNKWLLSSIKLDFPTPDIIQERLLGKTSGAMRQALQLPIKYLPNEDLVKPSENIVFPKAEGIQMHHIFPKQWVKDNPTSSAFGKWATNKDKIKELRECIVNKTPLTANSNITWKSMSPSSAMKNFRTNEQKKNKPIWQERFICDHTYDALSKDEALTFLELRAEEVEKWLTNQASI
jgi:hypothetical protein